MDQQLSFSSSGENQLISGPAGKIEVSARYGRGAESLRGGIVLICHPHPLFGGTMDNKVVTTLARAARDQGLAQVRFNFRGVGKSEGAHADMHGEAQDLQLLIDMVRRQAASAPLLLAGFSFGSGVSSLVMPDNPDILALHLVAPPVSKYQGVYPPAFSCPLVVYLGDQDEVIDARAARIWTEQMQSPAELHWFENTGHFFHGRLTDLHREFSASLSKQLEA